MTSTERTEPAANIVRRAGPAPLFRVEGGPWLPEGGATFLTARSGHRLRVALCAPAGPPRGSVVLSPGRTEPIEKYGEVMSELVERRFVVLVHDWAGQGLSGRFLDDPLRGDLMGGWQGLRQDYTDILDQFESELPRPWLAMGHSMGGALTALALAEGERRFAGAILCAPMIEFLAGHVPFWLVRPAVFLAERTGRATAVARPQTDPIVASFETNVLTHDRGRFERTRVLYRARPELRLGEPTWRWLGFAIQLRNHLAHPGVAERIECPLTVVAAGDDRVVNTSRAQAFAARLRRGTYVEVPAAFHEILMETDDVRARFWQAFERLADELGEAAPISQVVA